MARPRREISTEQKIDNILKDIETNENEIDRIEKYLHNLREKEQELHTQLNQEKLNLLLETMNSKNISLDRAKEIIDNMEG